MSQNNMKTWNVILSSSASMFATAQTTNGIYVLTVTSDYVWTDNSGALLFANDSFNPLTKAHFKEVFKILGPGLWLSVDIGSEDQQKNNQNKARSEGLSKKIIMEFKKGYKYQGLNHMAAKLGKKASTVEWELSQLVKAKKVKLEWVVEPQVQKSLDAYLNDIMKKYPGSSQESIKEMLKIKDVNVDYVQLSIWLTKNGYI